MWSLMIYTPRPTFFSGDQTKKNEMGVTCSAYGGEVTFIQDFGGET